MKFNLRSAGLATMAIVTGSVSFVAFDAVGLAQTDGCFMVTASGQTISLGHLCGVPDAPAASPSRSNVPTRPRLMREATNVERTSAYCDGLPDTERAGCYDNYDNRGVKYGTTHYGTSHGSSSSPASASSSTCDYEWQTSLPGRRCGDRNADSWLSND